MTWPTPSTPTPVPNNNVDAPTDVPASARTDLDNAIQRINTIESLLQQVIGNGRPLTLGGSEAATAFLNAALGAKLGNTNRSDVNTLDWYEEGTWTPVATFGSANVGMVNSWRGGRFTRIGNVVFFSLQCTWSNKGSSSGLLRISLPYPGNGSYQPMNAAVEVFDAASGVTLHSPVAQADNGGSGGLYIYDFNAGAVGSLFTDSTFAAAHGFDQGIKAFGMYFTN